MLTMVIRSDGRSDLTGDCINHDGNVVHVSESGPTARIKEAADWYCDQMSECFLYIRNRRIVN